MTSYYAATTNPHDPFPSIGQDESTDICIVGAGYTGLLTALELVEKGFSVTVLEAKTVGWGASGRNGGQIATGYQPGMIETAGLVGPEDAARLWAFSVEATELLRARIARHHISCDLKDGELYAAAKPSHAKWLREEQEFCERKFGFEGYSWIDETEIGDYLGSERYCAGLLDARGGHLHPLNYVLGLAEAARDAGVTIYENSPVLKLERGKTVSVRCANGTVSAKQVVLAGNAYLGDLNRTLAARIIPVSTFIIATEPLGAERARSLIATDACVSDTNYNLDYFRLSADNRLLYGGRDFAGHSPTDQQGLLRDHMLNTFPQLDDARIDFVWTGKVAVTRRRLPDIGRIGSNIYYAHGYSGQGVPLSSIVGKITAEAIAGDVGRFDVFGRIPHKPFPGGTAFRVPLLSLAMFYYRLRDML